MTSGQIEFLINGQREFFKSGQTLAMDFRLQQLEKLRVAILANENEIENALKSDLGKNNVESYMCEVGQVLSEIRYMKKHLRKFVRRNITPTPLAQFCSRSYTLPTPYGNVLILSPWNYPFLLALEPLVDAIAAGNTAVIKPSAHSPATSAVIDKIIKQCFDPEYAAVITGGREQNEALLSQKFDLVFFTGSKQVGKEILRRCAENLTPAILELGGKSPCIVDETANIKLAAKRIVFGKYLNCGQTCVAPDYVLCHSLIKDEFIAEVKKQITLQFGEDTLQNEAYGKIINERNFDRICGLIDGEKVIFGGKTNKTSLKISPTVMDGVAFSDKIMSEEIFGPVLPIISFEDFGGVIDDLKEKSKPLALYLFSRDRKRIKQVTKELSYGGGCINDTIIHLATSYMGFGGVGESGMGQYHGKSGFFAFSHLKSIVDKKNWIDIKLRYQPHSDKKLKSIKKFLK